MGEFGNNSYNSTDQVPPTAPNYVPESNRSNFAQYIQPDYPPNQNNRMLQGGVTEYGTKPNTQFQNGLTDNQVRTNVRNDVPLQGTVRETEMRASVQDNAGIPTNCLRIEDQSSLNRDVLRVPAKGGYRDYHNVFMKQSDYAVVQRAKAAAAMGQVNLEQVNLYDNTGHLIQPAYAVNVGGFFPVNYQPSTVVLNLYESQGMNNQPTYQRANNRGPVAIPEGLKQKYEKAKPFVNGLLRQLRSF